MHLRLALSFAALLNSAWSSKDGESLVTKQFHFKEDFFLTFHPLSNAIGPDNIDVLMSGLDDFGELFKDAWIKEIEDNLQDGNCKVDAMSLPKFSICDWRYPERYDVHELPTPGQAYLYPDGFVQRLYYEIVELTISCMEDFSYTDLDQDSCMNAAFAGNNFLGYVNPLETDCEEAEGDCLFLTAENITLESTSTAELYITRFTQIPLYLKCLTTDGYGPKIANKLIVALDRYFEIYVEEELKNQIMLQVPEGSVYGFASPYASGRKFCAHGAYYNYAGGNLVNQIPDADGILITKFTYGFDVIWFKPEDFDEELLPDIAAKITSVFDDGSFLVFLQEEYPDYDFIQDTEVCNAIDINEAEITLAPTMVPTEKPTSLSDIGEACTSSSQCAIGLVCHQESNTCTCSVETNEGCSTGNICGVYSDSGIPKCSCNMDVDDGENGCDPGQVCRFSCAFLVEEPMCFDDENIRDCDWWGDGYSCADGNKDGVIDKFDKSGGCNSKPNTLSPTEEPTQSPTYKPTPTPSRRPTDMPTVEPTLGLITSSPVVTSNPTSVDIINTDLPTSNPTLTPSKNPSSIPTNVPTSSPLSTSTPTFSSSEDFGSSQTSPPTYVRPAITASPIALPAITSPPSLADQSSCPGYCIIHPDDTEEDDCPITTSATCGGGNRGDGICPFEGYCCSKFGWCGTTAEYCESDSDAPTPSVVEAAAPLSPTYSLDAGQCGNGNQGEGLCSSSEHCCSNWGYCGEGENYCYTTVRIATGEENGSSDNEGTCGGGNVGNGKCSIEGHCCSRFGFCGEGDLYCTGLNEIADDSTVDIVSAVDESPLPDSLKPTFGFRCGVTEVDARSNCKRECTHHIQCDEGEECWGIQLNYCNTFEEGTHPVCTDLDMADNDRRCGFDEMSARGYCGPKCDSDEECGNGEFCFPTLLNLCECNEVMNPEESSTVFAMAKALIRPYFLESNEAGIHSEVEGKPRNESHRVSAVSYIFYSAIQICVAFLINLIV